MEKANRSIERILALGKVLTALDEVDISWIGSSAYSKARGEVLKAIDTVKAAIRFELNDE